MTQEGAGMTQEGWKNLLFVRERQKAHYPGFFDCFGKHSLMPGAGAGFFGRKNFRLTGNKMTEQFAVLKINFFSFLLAEIAVFHKFFLSVIPGHNLEKSGVGNDTGEIKITTN